MTARVRIGGQYLDRFGAVDDLVDSTVFRPDGFSGDFEASCTWAVPATFEASWFRRGAVWETIERGKRTWGGILAEPEVTDGVLSLHADGFGAQVNDWTAVVPDGLGWIKTSYVADDVIDYAHTSSGSPLNRFGVSIGAVATPSDDSKLLTIADLITRVAGAAGKFWWVDSYGAVTLVAEPTAPTYSLVPGTPRLGTADDNYASYLFGYYVSSVDGDGQPNGWAITVAGDDEMAAQYGRRDVVVDLTALGLMTQPEAAANIVGRFAQVGGRIGFTDSIDLTSNNLRRIGAGWSTPMSVRAGDRLRIPGVSDRTQASYRASLEVTLGEVTRVHAEQRATATPIGFVARDFEGAIAAASAPPTTV